MIATAVAATTDTMAFIWLGNFEVAAIAVNLSDVCGNRRRTAILARAIADAVSACGVFVVVCGVGPRVVGSGASRGGKGQWLR